MRSSAIWNPRVPILARVRLWWDRLWNRKDEFHRTYNPDSYIMKHMCRCERERYYTDVIRRRMDAHRRDEIRQDECCSKNKKSGDTNV